MKRKTDKHLPPCVYRKHGAFWHVKAGKWERLGGTLPQALAEYARRFQPASGEMPKLIARVLEHIRPTLKESTRRQYATAGRRLSAMLVEFAPDQVRMKHVAQLKAVLAKTPNMANRCLTVLRIVFAQAVEWQIVDSNPCVGIGRHAERKRRRLISWAEFHAIREKAPPRLQVVMDLLVTTGQRPSDVLAIRRADLRDDGIYFEQAKTDARLIVRWTPQMRDAVERAKSLHRSLAAVTLFHTRKGTKPAYRTLYDQWRRACIAAGVADADLRDLRALAGTETKRQGMNPTALLGHTSSQMTTRYLRDKEVPVVDGPSIRQALDK